MTGSMILLSQALYGPFFSEHVQSFLIEATKPLHDMEMVSFTYEKIIWTYVPDGIEAEDDWKAPKA